MKEERRTGPPADLDRAHLPMGEEMDRARWTLPPVGIVLLSLLGLAVVVGIIVWTTQPPVASSGRIEHIGVVEQHGGENVLVAVHVTLENTADKPLWVRHVHARLQTPDGEWRDDASSAVDHERYFQAYPELRQHAIEPLLPEAKVRTGEQHRGMLIFGFPVSRDGFERREAFTVTVEPYDRGPLVLGETIAPHDVVP